MGLTVKLGVTELLFSSRKRQSEDKIYIKLVILNGKIEIKILFKSVQSK